MFLLKKIILKRFQIFLSTSLKKIERAWFLRIWKKKKKVIVHVTKYEATPNIQQNTLWNQFNACTTTIDDGPSPFTGAYPSRAVLGIQKDF